MLIDGVPADDIGGAVEFANIDSVGIDKVEVLREPNSALYGSDALAGVVSLTTARGNTLLPLLTYSGDGGNFNTFRQVGTLSGTLSPLRLLFRLCAAQTHGTVFPMMPFIMRPMRGTSAGLRIPPTICALPSGISQSLPISRMPSCSMAFPMTPA